MQNLVKVLIVLSAVAFICAVAAIFFPGGRIMGSPPESFSRASANLALIAIALAVCNWAESKTKG